MAQKISPKSLRVQKILSHNFSMYSDTDYPKLWMKGYELANAFLTYSQKNNLQKMKKASSGSRRFGKGVKTSPSFLTARFYLSANPGMFKFCPVFFKFASQSISKKYNPIKTLAQMKTYKPYAAHKHLRPDTAYQRYRPYPADKRYRFYAGDKYLHSIFQNKKLRIK